MENIMDNKIDKSQYNIKIVPAFKEYRKAIVFESSGAFVPYLSVVLLSLVAHISPNNQYDIIILTHEIDRIDCIQLLKIVEEFPNVKLRFFDPSSIVKRYIESSKNKYLDINYYRMSLPWILLEYDVVLNLGADITIEKDINELINIEMNSNEYMAGVVDLGYIGRLKMDIPKEELDLSVPENYVNADVILLNLKAIRKNFTQDEVMNIWQKYKFRCAEQDALNLLFDGHVKHINLRWNVFPMRMASEEHIYKNEKERILEWKECLTNPYIIHYAAYPKPWDFPMVGYGNKWWRYAKCSVYYEEIIRRMCLAAVRADQHSTKIWGRKCADLIFPIGTARRKFIKDMFPKKSFQREFLKKIYYSFFKNPDKEWNQKFGKMK